jgi:4-amino-4-deoxy-L-arabinose transferase-like glycosyltransferase
MAGRRFLLLVIVLSAALQTASIARSLLPAQDGLKFIRIARQFQTDPWPDVVRDTDQHPLYPALVAVAEPAVACLLGKGPDTWRIAAQIVAALASVAILIPLFGLARSLFDVRIARMAVVIYALLPVHAEVGHDTLSDSLGLLCIVLSLRYGSLAISTASWRPALAAGLAGGIGYLARPEAVLAPLAVCVAWGITRGRGLQWRPLIASPVAPAVGLSALVLVGGYALVKGQVSEKLALRHSAALGAQQIMVRPVPQLLPRGLDDRHWDFSAKEDGDRTRVRSSWKALHWIAIECWDELCWGFAIMAVWGLARQRFILGLCHDPGTGATGRAARLVLAVFAGIFLFILVRHTTALGYVSGRHTLPLTAIAVPWAAAGTFVCLRGLGVTLPWSRRTAWAAGMLGSVLVVSIMVVYQLRPGHPTRWGHWAAGQWLAAHLAPCEVVLDTRGWARFVAEAPGYDYWHVRQALTDSHLAYVVVGHEELEARSTRSRTLNALLAFAATPVQDFPAFVGERNVGVRLYRFHRPDSWEGLAP